MDETKRMKKLFIVGAGGFGREVLQWAKDANRKSCAWDIVGFISDDPHALTEVECDYKILSDVENCIPSVDVEYMIAVGAPKSKKTIVENLRAKGANFASLIHPTAQVSEFVKIGEGTIICPNAEISPNVKIGNFCTILNAGIGHDVTVDDFTTISGGCFLNGGVAIGRGVFIGCGALIVPGKIVGDDAKIGIGSVVINNIPAGVSVFGNPAKRING